MCQTHGCKRMLLVCIFSSIPSYPFYKLQTCYCVCNLAPLPVNLPGALRRYRDGPSSKSFAITGKRPVVSVHYEHPQRESRANGVQHEHHARIMMEQKEHTRERSTKISGTCKHIHSYTQAKHACTHTVMMMRQCYIAIT